MQPRAQRGMWRVGIAAFLAAFVALALAVSVVLAQRALTATSDLTIRGEAELLVSAIADRELGERATLDDARLDGVLQAHAAEGLRFIAVVDGSGEVLAQAGERRLPAFRAGHPGDLLIEGGRARVAGMVPLEGEGPPEGESGPFGGPHHGPHGDASGPPGPPPELEPGGGPGGPHGPHDHHGHGPPPMLVLELEPPAVQGLRDDIARSVTAGVLASLVIIGLAAVWIRGVLRIARFEKQAEAERRLVSLGQMSAIMAHELRNPLAALKGHAQLLEEALDVDPAAQKKAARVVEGAERLEALTKNLLEFVRDSPLDLRSVPPRTLVDEALLELDAARVDVTTKDAPASISIDLGRLSRAVHNLVANALQASEPDQRVELELAKKGRRLVIVVRDHGPGLPPGSTAQLFEPFATTRARGTGLGLPIARRIAEQHGGSLAGETHAEGGAVFTLDLPLSASSS